MYSEALKKHINKPKWQIWLQVISIFLVWIFVIKGTAGGYSDHPVASTALMVVFNGAMLNIVLTMSEFETIAMKIDLDLGERIENLNCELNVLTEKYAALQQENTKLLKQNSRS